jgi:hypothetical protein
MAPENTVCSKIDIGDGKLDLEVVIARFAGDDSRISHALPASLSSEQRQLAKKLVGLHPQLDCESYGFGPERQLHLFKKRAGCHGVRMRVKNTFIDAWLESGDGKLRNSPVFRSLPSDLRRAVVVALVAPVSDRAESAKDDMDLVEHDDDNVQICSTPSPCTSPKMLGFPSVPSLAEVYDPSGTEFMTSPRRAQPSEQVPAPLTDASGRPPPMALKAQSIASVMDASQRLTPAPPPGPPPVSPCNVAMLAQGTEVEIDGLLQRPDFNGLSGTVQSWDPILRRYNILLCRQPGHGGQRYVKTKRENLRIKPPPPPPSTADLSAATLKLESCLPLNADGTFQGGETDMNDAEAASMSSSMPPNTQGWYSWQYSDPSMSPHGGWHDGAKGEDGSNMTPTADLYGTSEGTWDYVNNTVVIGFSDGIQSFDTVDNAGWNVWPLSGHEAT